jgi:hypothetical protein
LVVAIAAGIGLLRQGLFWLILSYFTLISALVLLSALLRRKARRLRIVDDECSAEQRKVENLQTTLAQIQAELTFSREDHEAAEGGYATLREAIIRTASMGVPGIEDFDDELQEAFGRIRQQQSAAHSATR